MKLKSIAEKDARNAFRMVVSPCSAGLRETPIALAHSARPYARLKWHSTEIISTLDFLGGVSTISFAKHSLVKHCFASLGGRAGGREGWKRFRRDHVAASPGDWMRVVDKKLFRNQETTWRHPPALI